MKKIIMSKKKILINFLKDFNKEKKLNILIFFKKNNYNKKIIFDKF